MYWGNILSNKRKGKCKETMKKEKDKNRKITTERLKQKTIILQTEMIGYAWFVWIPSKQKVILERSGFSV